MEQEEVESIDPLPWDSMIHYPWTQTISLSFLRVILLLLQAHRMIEREYLPKQFIFIHHPRQDVHAESIILQLQLDPFQQQNEVACHPSDRRHEQGARLQPGLS